MRDTKMDDVFMWEWVDGTGLERVERYKETNGTGINSLIIGVRNNQPGKTAYSFGHNEIGEVIEAQLDDPPMIIEYGGNGHWYDHYQNILPQLNGCTAIDVRESAATNMLAIKQLQLNPGETGELTVAYFELLEGTWQPERQRYTCVEKTSAGSVFKFEHLSSGFKAEFQVDAEDFVIDYPGLFRRVYPRVSDR
jgi:hypothetical protein